MKRGIKRLCSFIVCGVLILSFFTLYTSAYEDELVKITPPEGFTMNVSEATEGNCVFNAEFTEDGEQPFQTSAMTVALYRNTDSLTTFDFLTEDYLNCLLERFADYDIVRHELSDTALGEFKASKAVIDYAPGSVPKFPYYSGVYSVAAITFDDYYAVITVNAPMENGASSYDGARDRQSRCFEQLWNSIDFKFETLQTDSGNNAQAYYYRGPASDEAIRNVTVSLAVGAGVLLLTLAAIVVVICIVSRKRKKALRQRLCQTQCADTTEPTEVHNGSEKS